VKLATVDSLLVLLPLAVACSSKSRVDADGAASDLATQQPIHVGAADTASTGSTGAPSDTSMAPQMSSPQPSMTPAVGSSATPSTPSPSQPSDAGATGPSEPDPCSEEKPAPVPTMVTQPCTDDVNEDQPDLPCSQWVEWGTCDEEWMLERHVCDRSCGRCDGDTIVVEVLPPVEEDLCTPPEPADGEPDVPREGPTLPPLTDGQDGFTTRYWDCCKPHCGWPQNSSRPISSCGGDNGSLGGDFGASSACEGGPAHMCWNFGPQSNGDNIAYAFAAHNGVGCGACFQLDFTGESHNPKPDTGHDQGSQSLAGKSMIVQVINTGGIDSGQFDLLVPGGGVGDFDACTNQWGTSDLGERYGGFFLACQKENNFEYEASRACARDWCDRVFTGKDDLHAGCMWFVEWFGLADNPTMKYKEVPCPEELTRISGM